MAHHRCEFYQCETHDFTKWQIFSASNGLHVSYDLTRDTFVPSSAIRSAKSTVLQAQEVPQSGSFGPPRGGNRRLLPWTDMSFAEGKQRFVCFWCSEGFSGTSDCHLDRFSRMLDTSGEKSNTSASSKTAPLQLCQRNVDEMHCPQWAQSRRGDGESGPRCEFCTSKVAEKGDKTRQVTTRDVSFTKGKLMFSCF